jgi:hypothetical protein
MRARDIALVAFRLLAIWAVLSGLDMVLQTLLGWKTIAAQSMPSMAGVVNAPTSSEFFWMTISGLSARVVLGLLLWWVAPFLARVTCPSEAQVAGHSTREALYSAAAFLVGIWLVSDSLPGLAFVAFSATRPGTPAYDDGSMTAQVAQLAAKLVLGLAFLRARWLVRWALEPPIIGGPEAPGKGGGAEQADAADEAQGGTRTAS